MGLSVDDAVLRLDADPALSARFDEAFDMPGFGVTKWRLARALAAFVRSHDRPASRYRRYQDGDLDALTQREKEGLAVFTGGGHCATCHSGPGLTDGRMHTVRLDPPRPATDDSSRRRGPLSADVPSRLGRRMSNLSRLPPDPSAQAASAGGYGLTVVARADRQTLSLWEVRKTAPYFRDGSVASLSAALRTHVRELREVVYLNFESAKRLPISETPPDPLRPERDRVAPDELDARQIERLLAFLKSL